MTEQFRGLAQSVLKARSAPELPIIVLPPNIEQITDDALDSLAEASFPQMIAKLVK